MLTTSSMELISVAVPKEKLETLASHLIALGIFHPVDIRYIEEELQTLSPLRVEEEYARLETLEVVLQRIARQLSLSLKPAPYVSSSSYEAINETLTKLEGTVISLFARQDQLQRQLKAKETVIEQIKDFPFPIKKQGYFTFLDVSLGEIEEKNITVLQRSLQDIPHVFYSVKRTHQTTVVLVIALRRDKTIIEKVLKDLSCHKVEYPSGSQDFSKEVEEKISAEITQLKNDIACCRKDIHDSASRYTGQLSEVFSFILLKKSLLEAKKYSCSTERAVFLSGWVPSEEQERAINEIRGIDPASFIESKVPEDLAISKDEIPVKLVHRGFVKPFELLIKSYGLPRYGSIDPTIFVAISFLLMFGAMFGDLGQGLVLAFGAILLHRSRKKTVKQAAALALYCGISSSFFGLLYGSVFGFEDCIETLWLKPMHNIMEVFKVSIIFGVSLISAGIVLNIINALRDKDYMKAIFDKAGLITGTMYWVAIAAVSKMLVAQGGIATPYLIAIGIGFALLFFKPFIEIIFKTKKEKESLFVSCMESMVDILEIIMGYLANTVSFIRVAAFSLAHVGLFLAIFELSKVLKGVAGGAASVGVLIAGNIFIILLEGLVVCIQSLRLNYYEFFSKFFMAGKQVYKPLTMREQ